VITFELGLSEAETAAVVDQLKVPFMASNFGAPHTLVEQSTFFTYFEYDDAGLASIGVDRSTVRLALGYVNEASELIDDLAAALPAGASGDFQDHHREPRGEQVKRQGPGKRCPG
jgi:cystathionine gamma-synthase